MLLRFRFFLSIFTGLACAAIADAQADSYYTLGVEGFHDTYKEPIADLTDTTTYGSITANYMHERNGFFSAIDGRYSYGSEDHYKSDSGVEIGGPQYEGELRLRTGLEITEWHGVLMPYLGVGVRQFFDNGKNTLTNTGAEGYDRHITQFYLPFGLSYPFTSGDWTFTPNIEGDFMFYGRVSTHLGEIPGYYNIVNTQHTGYGVRGEFMVGQKYHYFSWQAGPFVRFWSVPSSDTTTDPSGASWVEPQNSRLQTGLALRLTY